jgi:protein TonB
MLAAMLFVLIEGAAASPTPAAGATTRPASAGGPHACAEVQYPVSALQTGTEGRTILKFTITAKGGVSDVSVNTSSGNADLDTAAMSCARDWLYHPATRDGVPVDTPWLAQVLWKIGVTAPYDLVDAEGLICIKADSVAYDEFKKARLHAVVRVHFANGAVSTAALAGTSGDPDLDSRVTACYRSMPPKLTANVPDGDELFVAMQPPDQ